MTGSRIGSDRLARLVEQLTEQDRRVLQRMAQHRYLRTEQLARFEFRDRPTELARLRAAHRTLKKLRVHGLIVMLERTVGGAARGSTAAIWTLTDAGLRAASYRDTEADHPRRRISEPSLIFLRHEVAVAELHLRLLEAAAQTDWTIERLELEPACWRRYLGPLGALATLKPDLSCDLENADYESRYFFEVDRATEPPGRIITKCLQYQEYYRTGEEERRGNILPLVVWIVPGEARREQLFRHLTTGNGINPRLYRVLQLDEIATLLSQDEEIGQLPEHQQPEGGEP
jgi:hypothetical protein